MADNFKIHIAAVIFFWLLIKINESYSHNTVSKDYRSRQMICHGASHASLVEHFFNHILTKFQSTPPACVCVQMCANQSTYCYPKGCLKPGDFMRHDTITMKPITKPAKSSDGKVSKAAVFPVEDQDNSEFNALVNNKYQMENKVPITKNFRPDPFENSFKTIFSIKRKPKLHFNYDIKEQVRTIIVENLNKMEAHVAKTRWPYAKKRLSYPGYTITEHPKEEIVENIETQTEETGDFDADAFKTFKRKYFQSYNDEESKKYINKHESHIDEAQYSIQNLIDNILRSNVEVNTDESSSRRVKMNVEIKEPNITHVINSNNLELTSEKVYTNTDKTNENHENKTDTTNYDGIDLIYSVIGDVESNDHISRKTFFDVLSPIAKVTNESNDIGLEIIAESVTVENNSNVNNFQIKEFNEEFSNRSDYIIDGNNTLRNAMNQEAF